MHRSLFRPVLAISLVCLVGVSLLYAATIYQVKQTPPVQLGTSGGNVMDRSASYCCSGTLGALVAKGGTQYILSNNHVLARSDQAGNGEDVSQPGMVDSNCSTANSNIVADFSSAPRLGSNVDAAIAQVRSGMVDPTGAILTIGAPASTTSTPAINMGVAKSGRTTGFTCASVGSVSTSVNVQYETECGGGSTYIVKYTNQVVVSSSKFSAGGDSGSLIVRSDTAQPVALLFAGSSTSTIANPIGDVVSALGGISFVGGATHAVPCSTKGRKPGPRNAAVAQAIQVKDRHADRLMLDDAVMGVGVGADDVNSSEAVIVVYVEHGRLHKDIPSHIDGVKTKIVTTDRIRAFGWNEPQGRACTVR